MPAVMITNGNNVHPADYHAEVTTEKIVVVGENATSEVVSASRAFRKAVEAVLVTHHERVALHEQAALAEHGLARLDHDLDASAHVDDNVALNAIVEASRGTILQAHFAKPEVQEVIVEILHHESRSQMNVHRLVFAAEPARKAS